MYALGPDIPYWSYLREYEREREAILSIVDEVFSSGRLILGPRLEEFERAFAGYCGAGHGIGVNSGTDALFIALKAMGIGAGDEVITVSNTAVPTVSAIRATGAAPVFADIEDDTFCMDPDGLERLFNKRTRCILPVHLYGQMAAMERISEFARDRGLYVIEDCAQAAGAQYKDKRAGSMGAIGAFSFYPTKILGAYGDAGMAVTSDEELAERLRQLRFYGMKDAYYSITEGYNSRLDEVQAALLTHKLRVVDDSVQSRRKIAALYDEGLSGVGDIITPVTRSGNTHQFYVYTIRTSVRDRLRERLSRQGIETKVNYPTPIHLMSGYAFLGYKPGGLPRTERAATEILSLPLYPDMPGDDGARVIGAVREYFRGGPG